MRTRKQAAPPPEEEEDDQPRKRPVARRDEDDEDAEDERPSRRGSRRSGRPLQPHRGTLILILGIGALVGPFLSLPTPILGPFAWWLGNIDLKEMDAGRMDPEGRQHTQIGKICGMVATIMMIVGLVVGCLIVVLFFGFAGFVASKQ